MLALTAAVLAIGREPAWQTVTVSKGWTIEVPKGATELKVAPGKPVPGMRFANRAFTDGDASYTISVATPSAPWDPKARMDTPIADFVGGICHSVNPAVIKYQRDLLFNGWPGLEDVIMGHEGLAIYVRTYYIYGTIFSVGIGYTAADGRPETAARFISSLKHSSSFDGPLSAAGPVFVPFEPSGAGFLIDMPGKPEAKDPPGSVSHRFVSAYGNRQYIVGYAALPSDAAKATDEDKKKLIGVLIDHAIAGLDAKAVAPPKSVSRGGLEFQSEECFTVDGINARIDATIIGTNAYSILMVYPAGHAGSPDIGMFFDSFRLVKS